MARPKKLPEDIILRLAERHWSTRQIAAAVGCDESSIRQRLHAKVENARHNGAGKLLDILWQRGVTEKSDRVLVHLADRVLGPTTKKVEVTELSKKYEGKTNLDLVKDLRQTADQLEREALAEPKQLATDRSNPTS